MQQEYLFSIISTDTEARAYSIHTNDNHSQVPFLIATSSLLNGLSCSSPNWLERQFGDYRVLTDVSEVRFGGMTDLAEGLTIIQFGEEEMRYD